MTKIPSFRLTAVSLALLSLALLVFAVLFMPRGIVGTIKDRLGSLGQKVVEE